MEKDYQKALEVIFVYDYRCAFKHNICGDLPKVPHGMSVSFLPLPPNFFAKPMYPPVSTAIEDMAAELHLSEAIQKPGENTPTED